MQKSFPDANALSKSLHDVSFKGIWMLDPGIKFEKGYEAYDSGSAIDAWVQTGNGKPYIGMSISQVLIGALVHK